MADGAIHALGAALVVARFAHAVGYRGDDSMQALRAIGAIGSTLTLAVASGWAIAIFF